MKCRPSPKVTREMMPSLVTVHAVVEGQRPATLIAPGGDGTGQVKWRLLSTVTPSRMCTVVQAYVSRTTPWSVLVVMSTSAACTTAGKATPSARNARNATIALQYPSRRNRSPPSVSRPRLPLWIVAAFGEFLARR